MYGHDGLFLAHFGGVLSVPVVQGQYGWCICGMLYISPKRISVVGSIVLLAGCIGIRSSVAGLIITLFVVCIGICALVACIGM